MLSGKRRPSLRSTRAIREGFTSIFPSNRVAGIPIRNFRNAGCSNTPGMGDVEPRLCGRRWATRWVCQATDPGFDKAFLPWPSGPFKPGGHLHDQGAFLRDGNSSKWAGPDVFKSNVFNESDPLRIRIQSCKAYAATLEDCIRENKQLLGKLQRRLRDLERSVFQPDPPPKPPTQKDDGIYPPDCGYGSEAGVIPLRARKRDPASKPT